jgi:hypothetical protein
MAVLKMLDLIWILRLSWNLGILINKKVSVSIVQELKESNTVPKMIELCRPTLYCQIFRVGFGSSRNTGQIFTVWNTLFWAFEVPWLDRTFKVTYSNWVRPIWIEMSNKAHFCCPYRFIIITCLLNHSPFYHF